MHKAGQCADASSLALTLASAYLIILRSNEMEQLINDQ
jgi:hypothetical protein